MVEAFQKESPFNPELHLEYLLKLDKTEDPDAIGVFMNEHLKMAGAYWCIGSLKLLKKLGDERKEEMVNFIQEC